MADNKDIKMLNTRISKDIIRYIKVFCAQQEISVQEFVTEAVEDKLKKDLILEICKMPPSIDIKKMNKRNFKEIKTLFIIMSSIIDGTMVGKRMQKIQQIIEDQ